MVAGVQVGVLQGELAAAGFRVHANPVGLAVPVARALIEEACKNSLELRDLNP